MTLAATNMDFIFAVQDEEAKVQVEPVTNSTGTSYNINLDLTLGHESFEYKSRYVYITGPKIWEDHEWDIFTEFDEATSSNIWVDRLTSRDIIRLGLSGTLLLFFIIDLALKTIGLNSLLEWPLDLLSIWLSFSLLMTATFIAKNSS